MERATKMVMHTEWMKLGYFPQRVHKDLAALHKRVYPFFDCLDTSDSLDDDRRDAGRDGDFCGQSSIR